MTWTNNDGLAHSVQQRRRGAGVARPRRGRSRSRPRSTPPARSPTSAASTRRCTGTVTVDAMRRPSVLAILIAVGSLAIGIVHLKLYFDGYDDTDVGPSFLLNAVAAGAAAVIVIVWDHALAVRPGVPRRQRHAARLRPEPDRQRHPDHRLHGGRLEPQPGGRHRRRRRGRHRRAVRRRAGVSPGAEGVVDPPCPQLAVVAHQRKVKASVLKALRRRSRRRRAPTTSRGTPCRQGQQGRRRRSRRRARPAPRSCSCAAVTARCAPPPKVSSARRRRSPSCRPAPPTCSPGRWASHRRRPTSSTSWSTGSPARSTPATCNGLTFNVMAGAGFDAAMIDDADAHKDRLGMVAYLRAGVRNARDRGALRGRRHRRRQAVLRRCRRRASSSATSARSRAACRRSRTPRRPTVASTWRS